MATDRGRFRDASGRHELRPPVVYLDQSHLSDAFDGKRGIGADAAINAELAAIVEEVAHRGTLCLSSGHLVELANRPRLDEALAVARWLDGLEPMWFQAQGAAERELADEVERRLGLKPPAAVKPSLPIHSAITAAMQDNLGGVSVAGTVDILRDPTIAGMLRRAHGRRDREIYARQALAMFEKLHGDRSTLAPGTTPEEVAANVRRKLGWHLQIEAREAIDRRPFIIGESRPTHPEISDAVLALLAEQRALPLNKVASHVMCNVGKRIAGQKLGSGGFEGRYASFPMDMVHAFAAAVVDVFTCDSFMGGVMGDFRTNRGMEPQVSLYGLRDRAALVAELRRQCAAPLAGS